MTEVHEAPIVEQVYNFGVKHKSEQFAHGLEDRPRLLVGLAEAQRKLILLESGHHKATTWSQIINCWDCL